MKGRAAVTLSNENGLSRFRACPGPRPRYCGPQRAAHGRPAAHLAVAAAVVFPIAPAPSRRLPWAQ
jgi:hypothetical protein